MKHLIFTILLSISFNVMAERTWSVGGGLGYDPNGFTSVIVTGDYFPTTRSLSWGARTFGQLGQYDDGETGVQFGALPVVTWKGFYAGIGASVGNTTQKLGTPLNFVTMGGWRYQFNDSWSIDGHVDHWSHCARCGIAEDEENGGVTTFNLSAIYRF